MLTEADLQMIIPMLGVGFVVFTVITFLMWQEKRLENLEKKSKK
jgi:hypothetical protein